ncbi:FtsH-binding integral membrane protein [Bradyrhizobium elkanii]|uniref:hypothetical protein n=1 Tax=Bradyrhizobium elkanii TaxID=29448 RepID=UPI002166E18A|nr:hypothetical protein [Bradyrhizobium elkanii]MCS3476258.1 FtsH-binding integral membrane protein [Bradyrhizobium elkanii]MCS3686671.1 FtsH-binding integral membrane protein [Bradyrhizobium elkanii]
MALTSANLVGYLRAEFKKASLLRVWLFFLQLAAALPAAIAVLVPDSFGNALYWLAGLGAALLIGWWFLNSRYTRIRNAAQSARRGALLLGGLHEALSPGEIDALRERFTVNAVEAAEEERADYYATTLPAGPARLGEMLEESAFYSEQLQRISSTVMLVVLALFAILFVIIMFGITPYVSHDTAQALMRVFLAMLVFGMSGDVFGAFRAHRDAANDIRDIRQRLKAADAAGYPIADVLLAFADYNAAVESAPESVPCAYKVREKHLNERWAEYQRDRDERRAAQGKRQ